MLSKRIKNILVKYITNNASFSDLDELESWAKDSKNQKEFITYVKINYLINYNLKKFNANKTKHKLKNLIEKEKRSIKIKKIKIIMKYAAVVIGFVCLAYFYKDLSNDAIITETPTVVNTKIKPGTSKATLTLADGSVLELGKSKILETKNAKTNGTEIIYKAKNTKEKNNAYNYLTIPRGGQYFLKLSDGTKVWLNSESQLKYPVNFSEGKTRIVELVYGEAYFDVSPSHNHKGAEFKVFHNKQEIHVLGTEFNIKAYKDESNIYTTLVEGKVSITYEDIKQNLMPTQQSSIDIDNKILLVKTVDVYNEISWKEGVFSFEDKSLKEIMKVLSRWYDIDIVFHNKQVENEEFIGVLGKEQNMEEILTNIKSFGIINDFKILDKKIILK